MMDFRSIVACAGLVITALDPAPAAAEDKITIERTIDRNFARNALPGSTVSTYMMCVNGGTEHLRAQLPDLPRNYLRNRPYKDQGTLAYGKFCLPLADVSPASLSRVLQEIHAIRMPGRIDALTAAVKTHIEAAEARNSFFENQMIAELQARMDRWPAELLADQVAYEAFRDQIMADLQDIVETGRPETEQ